MACNSVEDNESIMFATNSETHGSHFDPFFDLGPDFTRLEDGNATGSSGSLSLDTALFGDIGHNISFRDKDFYQAAILQSRICGRDLILATPVQVVTRLQQLNHNRQQDSILISGAQLMALENKDNSQFPMSLARSTYPIRTATPHTPPTTPQHCRVNLAPALNKETSFNLYQTSNGSSLFKSSQTSAKKLRLSQSMAPVTPNPQQDDISASCTQWTERLRSLAVRSPPLTHTLPTSPPLSTKVEQSELPPNPSDTTLLDAEDDPFEPFSSAATATSSSNSKHPFWDDSSSSTMGSSPWNLDAPVELFGLKEDVWDPPALESDNHSSDHKTYISGYQEHLLDSFDGPHKEARNSTPSSTGLGLSFGTNHPDSDLLDLSDPSDDLSFDCTVYDTIPVQKALPSRPPTSDIRASKLVSETSTAPRDTTSNPSHTKSGTIGRRHRRTKSAPSLQGTLRGAKSPASHNSPAASNMAFVNFTPDDRSRILTGVAPSGSSKTKARREKEALERRKKLSEAARRLVFEAGGDGNAVERELSD